ncbi:TetR/AcrR family transcriptional regulator [Streptosporangium lutulentum]|uniref:AcrR family transcriptional regulator n=1 Tax=Streptosporangium lutulentum TaxID=1461250 RepID=A0ABT9QRN4_9ACTN|nr:TetR/AcrR family transcriptional regulator [Streptosporangium lutulentum]MDP9848704.1 AcrR family transcriptional regulator [Streptosporangium lutulentum]
MTSTSQRAAPLPPDERRAALVASTLSLVLAHGPDVSTRQIAQAAGVAEGTIFRVFTTKEELVDAAVASAFDLSPLLGDLTAIDRTAPLQVRLVAAVEILQQHTTRIFRLVDALGPPWLAKAGRNPRARTDQGNVIRQALAELIEPGPDRLRCEPLEAARRLQLMTTAGSHPRIVEGNPLSPPEIVSMLLDGIRLRPESEPSLGHDPSPEHGLFPEPTQSAHTPNPALPPNPPNTTSP